MCDGKQISFNEDALLEQSFCSRVPAGRALAARSEAARAF